MGIYYEHHNQWNTAQCHKALPRTAAGQNPLDIDGVIIAYNDINTHVGKLTYNASAGGSIGSSSNLGLKPSEWNYTMLTTSGYGDTDTLLEIGRATLREITERLQ